jgi:hypothetical protein
VNEASENFLYRFSVGSCVLVLIGLFIRIRLKNLELTPLGMHVLDALWIVPVAAALLAGNWLWFLLLQPVYKRVYGAVIGGDWAWLWRLLAGTYTLFLVAVAKVYADHTLVTATSLPAGWFPRSQEILTGAFFVSLFLISLTIIPMLVIMLTSFTLVVLLTILIPISYLFDFFNTFVMYFALLCLLFSLCIVIGRTLRLLPEPVEQPKNRVESVSLEPLLDRLPGPVRRGIRSTWHTFLMCRTWFQSLLIYQKGEKLFLGFFSFLFLVVNTMVAYSSFLEWSEEYWILIPSFVPNVETQPVFDPNRKIGLICQRHHKDAWIRFIDEKKIVVAIPRADKDASNRGFTFGVGTCERSRADGGTIR